MGILDKIISAKEDRLLKEKASISLDELIKASQNMKQYFLLKKFLLKKIF